MDNEYYANSDVSSLAEDSRFGRGCRALLILVLLGLIICCSLVFLTTLFFQLSPGFRELLTGLLNALLTG